MNSMNKTISSLTEDPFFKKYGGGESNGSEREYYYDDYEDYSEND